MTGMTMTKADIGEIAYRGYCSTYTAMIAHRAWEDLYEWERYAWNVAGAEAYVLGVKDATVGVGDYEEMRE